MTDEEVIVVSYRYEADALHLLDHAEGEVAEKWRHVVYMCTEIRRRIQAGRRIKAMRWLGFVQGVLWEQGVYTIEELREHNRSGEDDDEGHAVR